MISEDVLFCCGQVFSSGRLKFFDVFFCHLEEVEEEENGVSSWIIADQGEVGKKLDVR